MRFVLAKYCSNNLMSNAIHISVFKFSLKNTLDLVNAYFCVRSDRTDLNFRCLLQKLKTKRKEENKRNGY